MKLKSLLPAAVLFLSVVGISSAKSWDIIVDSTAKAGAVQLPAGQYHVKLVGATQAVFTADQSGQKYTVNVKVEKADKKFTDTAVENTQQNGTEVIQSIELGGTDTRIDIGE
jgi:hypothetical protein